jgi:hypothetical protein
MNSEKRPLSALEIGAVFTIGGEILYRVDKAGEIAVEALRLDTMCPIWLCPSRMVQKVEDRKEQSK